MVSSFSPMLHSRHTGALCKWADWDYSVYLQHLSFTQSTHFSVFRNLTIYSMAETHWQGSPLKWNSHSLSVLATLQLTLFVMNDNRWMRTRIIFLDSSHGWPISLLDPPVEWQRTTWLYPTLCLVIPFDSFPFPNTASFCDSYYSMTPILTHTTKPSTLDTAL